MKSAVFSNNSFALLVLMAAMTVATAAPAAIQGEYFVWTDASPPVDPYNPVNHRGTRIDGNVNFNWDLGAPGIGGIGIDLFSVRWRGQVYVPTAGIWTFYTNTDDGARLYLNGELVINQWVDQGPTEYSATRTLDVGWHDIHMQYYENGGGAVATLSYSGPGVGKQIIPAGQLRAEFGKGLLADYYNGNWGDWRTLRVSRNDGTINFEWGNGSPQPEVNADNFSVRWRGKVAVHATGDYTFYVTSDDGAALSLRGVERFNNLHVAQSPTEYSASLSLTAGQKYFIEVRVNEFSGGAMCRLEWTGPGIARQVIPEQRLHAILNEAPSDISISSASVGNNFPANTVVGVLSTSDVDNSTGANPAQTHTYALVAGTGDTHNGLFNISGNNLRTTNANMTPGAYSVRIRTTDNGQIPNNLSFEKAFTITVNDTTPPTVTQAQVETGLTVLVTFSEPMGTGVLTPGNYAVSGAGRGSLAANPNTVVLESGNRYRLTWSAGEMVNGGTITVTVSNAQDVAGNPVGTPSSASHTNGGIGVAPTVTGVSVASPNVVRVTFSEPMGAGATATANYSISGGGRGSLAANPNHVGHFGGNTYEMTWSAGAMLIGGDVTITVANAQDVAGNPVGSPNSRTHVGGGQAIPPNPPVVAGTTPTNNRRPVWSWTPGGGGSGNYRYDLDSSGIWVETSATSFTPSSDLSDGVHRLVVQERDSAGNWSVDGFFDILVDATPPNPPIVSGTTPTNNPRPTWTWAPGGGDGTGNYRRDLNASGTWVNTTELSFAPDFDLFDGPHTLLVQERDALGNWSASGTRTITVDTVPPNTTLVSVDVVPNPTNSTVIPMTVTFDKSVAGFVDADMLLVNASVDAFTPVSSQTYTFNLLPSSQGVFSVQVPAAAASDSAGNGNLASAVFSRTFESDRPTVTLSSPAANPTNALSIPVTVTFDSDVTGFGMGSLVVVNGAVSDFVPVSGSVYTFSLEPADPGAVTARVPENVAQDGLGAWNTASNLLSRIYDPISPSVSLSSGALDPTNSVVPVLAVFSEPVFGFTALSVSVTNATVDNFTGGDGDETFTFVLTPTLAEGEIAAAIPAGVVVDAAGNPNTESNALSRHYDSVPPVVSGVAVQSGLSVEVTFSEAMDASALVPASYLLSGTGKGTLTQHPDAVTQAGPGVFLLTWNAGEMLNGGDIMVSLVAVTDTAGNAIADPNSGVHAGGAIALPPVAACKNALVVELDAAGGAVVYPADVDNGSNDDSGIVVWRVNGVSEVVFTCADIALNPHLLTLRVEDAAGNADECTLEAVVVDSLPPVISIPGANPRYLYRTLPFAPPAASAVDNCDGVVAAALIDDGGLDTNVVGEYTVLYEAGDSAGNVAQAELLVVVQETVPIVITPVGDLHYIRPVGGTVTFAIEAVGSTGLSYQWKRNFEEKSFVDIDSANSASFTIASIVEEDAGEYLCEVSDSITTEQSDIFTLTIGAGVPAAGLLGLAVATALIAALGAGTSRRRR